eukprot:GGOE01040980.1.p2 GENE.GGOE01040980.1~~GGOE01040980.1.p2  ORF type:complete len:270 (+),score=43.80 GGOE01040980.1:37-810(+)
MAAPHSGALPGGAAPSLAALQARLEALKDNDIERRLFRLKPETAVSSDEDLQRRFLRLRGELAGPFPNRNSPLVLPGDGSDPVDTLLTQVAAEAHCTSEPIGVPSCPTRHPMVPTTAEDLMQELAAQLPSGPTTCSLLPDVEEDFDAEVAGAIAQVLDAVAVERLSLKSSGGVSSMGEVKPTSPGRLKSSGANSHLEAVIAQVLNSTSDSDDSAADPSGEPCSNEERSTASSDGSDQRANGTARHLRKNAKSRARRK